MYSVLDLGSNSFHLVIADKDGARIDIVKTLSIKVQLAEALAQSGKISREAHERAIAALKEFRHVLLEHPVTHFCVVGTNTLREAKNAGRFIQDANALGFPVNVISGVQEAYYIYRGTHAFLSHTDRQRLVIDIGGGSTEFAVGAGDEPDLLDSLPLGCVTLASIAQPNDDAITHKTLARLRRTIHEVLDRQLNPAFYDHAWDEVYASSGTAKMLRNIARANNLGDGTLTQQTLMDIEDRAVKLGSVRALERLEGLKPNRRTVFPSGLAILQSIMDHLGIDHID